MKILALLGAGLLAVGSVAAVPADAQPRHGYDSYGRGHDGYGRGRDYRHDRGWRGDRAYRGGPRFRGGQRFRGGRGYGRGRVVCRVRRGYYGPQRYCFRAYR